MKLFEPRLKSVAVLVTRGNMSSAKEALLFSCDFCLWEETENLSRARIVSIKTNYHSPFFCADIPYIPQFFHLPENLTYQFRISTQRIDRSSCILNLKNERLNLGHCTSIHSGDSGGDVKIKAIKKDSECHLSPWYHYWWSQGESNPRYRRERPNVLNLLTYWNDSILHRYQKVTLFSAEFIEFILTH